MKQKKSYSKLILYLFILLTVSLMLLVSTQNTYAAGKACVRYRTSDKGYYVYNSSGKRMKKNGVIYLQNVRVNAETFNGYYYYNGSGRINYSEMGLVYLNCKASNGRKFKGYYYRDTLSQLASSGSIRKVSGKNGANGKFAGYHYFGTNGKLDLTSTSHKLNTTYKNITYKGYYCFAGANGSMIRNTGLVSLGDHYYYITDSNGKCLSSDKKNINGLSYSFAANGKGKITDTKLNNLESKLKKQLKGYGGTWSVYVKRLDTNDTVMINNRSMTAASIIKPFVMASTFNQIKMDEVKETKTIKSLMNSMITISSNDSYNELVKRQSSSYSFSKGRNIINDYLKTNGYSKTEVHHTLHPSSGSLFSDGRSNKTSVKDCGILLESIYRNTCIDSSSSRKMLKYLLKQQRRWKIPAGLPSGTKVANKTGETSTLDHDIAIVYSPRCTYILCIMTQNAPSATSRIAKVSRTVYRYFN